MIKDIIKYSTNLQINKLQNINHNTNQLAVNILALEKINLKLTKY